MILKVSTCWRLKVTVVGSSSVGKSSFIKGTSDFEVSRFNNLVTLGISFEVGIKARESLIDSCSFL